MTTQSGCLAILDPAGVDKTSFVKDIIRDSRVQNHFTSRCVFVSCEYAQDLDEILDRLAAGLGIIEAKDNGISAIFQNLAAHERTLIFLDGLDAIYQLAVPDKQEATDVLLASLASIDELTLLVFFNSTSLPECVAWKIIESASWVVPPEPQRQASLALGLSAEGAATQAVSVD